MTNTRRPTKRLTALIQALSAGITEYELANKKNEISPARHENLKYLRTELAATDKYFTSKQLAIEVDSYLRSKAFKTGRLSGSSLRDILTKIIKRFCPELNGRSREQFLAQTFQEERIAYLQLQAQLSQQQAPLVKEEKQQEEKLPEENPQTEPTSTQIALEAEITRLNALTESLKQNAQQILKDISLENESKVKMLEDEIAFQKAIAKKNQTDQQLLEQLKKELAERDQTIKLMQETAQAMQEALQKAGVNSGTPSPDVGGVNLSDSSKVSVNQTYTGGPSSSSLSSSSSSSSEPTPASNPSPITASNKWGANGNPISDLPTLLNNTGRRGRGGNKANKSNSSTHVEKPTAPSSVNQNRP